MFASFEESTEPISPQDELEDVTEEIFGALGNLEGCQMLCKPSMDLFGTMSCFEVMDPKMDARMHRNDTLTLGMAREQGILIPSE